MIYSLRQMLTHNGYLKVPLIVAIFLAVLSCSISYAYPDILVPTVSAQQPPVADRMSAIATTSVSFTPPPPPVQAFPPSHISIPSVGIDARVISLGVTAEGRLDTPDNFVDAGWYRYGPMPGQKGSAVIDGHVDNGGKVPGPFKHLKGVKAGDKIEIDAANGSRLYFTVIRSDIYKTSAFPSEAVFHDSSGKLLKIITCNGAFVRSLGTYDHRLVVTAALDE